MRPPRVLVLYGTNYGQTVKIAFRIANLVEAKGAVVTCLEARGLSNDTTRDVYDAVIVGASVIRGRHQVAVQKFASTHYNMLNRMPSAFFSVSGSAASPDERGRADARRCAEDFLRATHWRPALTELVGGAIAYTKYGPLLRWIMKQIAKRNGGPTDTSRDHELTNWSQVEWFAERFTAMLAQTPATTAALSLR